MWRTLTARATAFLRGIRGAPAGAWALPSAKGGWLRIEMAADGFAIGLPPGWRVDAVADYASLMRSAESREGEAYRDLMLSAADALDESGALRFMATDPSTEDNCSVFVRPSDGLDLRSLVSGYLENAQATREQYPELAESTPEVAFLDLHAGDAARLVDKWDYSDGPAYFVDFILTDGVVTFKIGCTSPHPPDDRWLAIAESFELLPAE